MNEDAPRNSLFEEDLPAVDPLLEAPGPPVEEDSSPAKKKMLFRLALAALLIVAAALAAWYFLSVRPEKLAAQELSELTRLMFPVIRAEELSPEQLENGRRQLAAFKAQSRAGEQLLQGGLAFLDGDLKQAGQRFDAARLMAPENPWPISFLAAANLRQGNSALAAENYLQSLELKKKMKLPLLALASDQMGLALSYFLLHKTEEALAPAEQAYQNRQKNLGPTKADTLSAANRLAAIEVALGKNEDAEELLKQSYLAGLKGGSSTEAATEESILLLTVLLGQSGRLNELEEFLNQEAAEALAQADGGAEGPPTAELPPTAAAPPTIPERAEQKIEPPQEREPSPRPVPMIPVTAETLAQWEQTARALAGGNDALAAELWLHILQNRSLIEKKDVYHPDYRPAVLALVRAYIGSGQYERALADLKPLLENIKDQASPEYRELVELMAESLEGKGSLPEAERLWQGLAETVDGRLTAALKGKKSPAPADVDLSLHLHLKLAENMLRQGRVASEAVIELQSALRRPGKSAGSSPEAIPVNLRLARIQWRTGQIKSAAETYRRAQSLAEAQLKKTSAPEAQAGLKELIQTAAAEAADLKAKKEAPPLVPEKLRAPRPALPSPDLLRLELSALEALGQLPQFGPHLEPVLKEAAAAYGPTSQAYMRYYSLKLKWLEESGQVDELTKELLAQADNPPGRNAAEKALNRGSALVYAARVNEKSGRAKEALELYQKALEALSGFDEAPIAARRAAVEEALQKLKP